MKRQWFLSFLCVLYGVGLFANHIQVSRLGLSSIDPIRKTAIIECSLRWENSWRLDQDPANYDAAWVFFKFRLNNGAWQHLHPAPQGHAGLGPTQVSVQSEKVIPGNPYHPIHNPVAGLLVYRAGAGTGDLVIDTLRIPWHYGLDGIEQAETVEIKAFAIEMVYVPEGPFQLGDGQSTGTFRNIASNTPVTLGNFATVIKCEDTSSDDAQLEGSGIWIHGTQGLSRSSASATDINPRFPTGYRGFYCMKYEVSQQNYADFLNTLSVTQAATRAYTGGTYRHGITLQGGKYFTGTPHLPNNWMNWTDAAAFADWAALRPMTETEFEKACRGNLPSVGGEFAWGNTSIANSSYVVQWAGQPNETVPNPSPTAGNAVYDQTTTLGPLRSGIFAGSGQNNRVRSGASWWGIMELSGNLVELCITLGRTEGRAFTGSHGDGALDASGDANVADWPGNTAAGIGFRGGSFAFGATLCRISDRLDAASNFNTRFEDIGFRAAR